MVPLRSNWAGRVRDGRWSAAYVAVPADGITFQLALAADRAGRGLGLLGMHERAEALGGEVRLESSPGAGTAIRVRLPWNGRV